MERSYYYIYCKGILGVKTNIKDFKWVYGSTAPESSVKEYDKCIVKFDLCIKPEKNLTKNIEYDKRFQLYTWNESKKRLSYRRLFPLNVRIGYDLRIDGNQVIAEIGENYYRFIKNRTMNLHGMYYLLSDIANVMLLRNGFLTLYSSAIYHRDSRKCVLNFAPPNTGKTFTATTLCEQSDCELVGEDVVITDGNNVFACPWTNSYRKITSDKDDNARSFGRLNKKNDFNICEECKLTDIVVLSLGKEKIETNKNNILKRVRILNGYLFNYCSSPIVKIMGYFDDIYNLDWNMYAAQKIDEMANYCNCYEIQSSKSSDFAEIFINEVFGKK